MRTYAVRLIGPANYGPEFNSIPEASQWGMANVEPDAEGRRSFLVAYLRDGHELTTCLVQECLVSTDEDHTDPTRQTVIAAEPVPDGASQVRSP